MNEWWEGMTLLGKVFALIAVPSTLILLLQTVLFLFGLGGSHDADSGDMSDFDGSDGGDYDASNVDFDASDGGDFDASAIEIDPDGPDAPPDAHDNGFTLFSVRGIVAMLCIGGWSGLVMVDAGISNALAIVLSLAFGAAALVGMAYLMKAVMTLQSSGNIDLGNAIGKTGRVYLPIPPAATGAGKINITVQDSYLEVNAITLAGRKLATGEMVRVVSTDETGMLVVEPLLEPKKEPDSDGMTP